MSEMSTTPDPATTPKPPATPSRRNGHSANSPATPRRPWTPSGREMAQHPTEPSKYINIGIHTAKCDVCNARNIDPRMLRCPECTWQICGDCRAKKNDNLAHGNVTPKTMPSNRKKLPDIIPFGQRRTASPKLETTKSATSASATKQAENIKAMPASIMKQKLHAAKQGATSPKSGEKRRAETMPAQSHELSVFPDADDDESESAPTSPSIRRKCQKTITSNRNIPEASNGSPNKHSSITPQQKAASAEMTTASYLKAHTVTSLVHESAKAVEAHFGISGSAYKEHPLARPANTTINTVKTPLKVQRNFKPHRSAAEIQRGIQEGVAKKLEQDFGWPANPEYASESVSVLRMVHSKPDTDMQQVKEAQQKTIRDVVNAEVKRVVQERMVDGALLVVVIQAIEQAALKARESAVQLMAAPFRAVVADGMDMELLHLNDTQVATLRGDVCKAAEQTMKNVVPVKVSDERSEHLSKA